MIRRGILCNILFTALLLLLPCGAGALRVQAAAQAHAASVSAASAPTQPVPTQPVQATLAPATLNDDPAHPAHAEHWVDTRLYFELGPYNEARSVAHAGQKPARRPVTEAQWMRFLDREVTPRFPDGLSVQNVYGQWKGAHDTAPHRGRSKVLIVDYPESPENEARIDAIRSAWKQMTGEHSVLKVTVPADISF